MIEKKMDSYNFINLENQICRSCVWERDKKRVRKRGHHMYIWMDSWIGKWIDGRM